MINQAIARKYWPNSDPIGSQIEIGKGVRPEYADDPGDCGIVGICMRWLDQPSPPAMYLPMAQVPDEETALNAETSPMVWAIRTRSGLSINPAVIENKLTEASGGLPVGKVLPMDVILLRSTARSDFTTLLLAIFGVSALVLAAIGMYGLMAYSVERTDPRDRDSDGAWGRNGGRTANDRATGYGLALAGAALGVAGAYWLTRFLASFLFGVELTIRLFSPLFHCL